MVDAYEGLGRSWSEAFKNPAVFRDTIRTRFVRGRAETLLQMTKVEPLVAGEIKARLITCVVRPWTR